MTDNEELKKLKASHAAVQAAINVVHRQQEEISQSMEKLMDHARMLGRLILEAEKAAINA